jgi:hypothetical protein
VNGRRAEMDACETGHVRIGMEGVRDQLSSSKWLLQSEPKHMATGSVREPGGVLRVPPVLGGCELEAGPPPNEPHHGLPVVV